MKTGRFSDAQIMAVLK
jgi:putative transposase